MIHRFSDRAQDSFEESSPRRTFIGRLVPRRVPILVGLGILLVAAITLVLVLPRQFQSQLDILVRNKLPLSARVTATGEETVDEQRMQSELALLHSPELAAKVVDPDYPTQPDATHSAGDLKRHQAAVALFSQQLIATVAPNSNLIHVVVTAEDPHRAGELASRLLEVFFASQSEVARPTPATAFFLAESSKAHAAWQDAQLALDDYRLAHPIAPTGNAADLTLQIAALNHQIQRNDEQIDATIGRILAGERKLITIPAHPLDPRNKSRNRGAMPLLSVAQLNAMLAIYNDEQAILLTRPPTDAEAVRASLSLAGQIADTNAARHLAEQAAAPERDPAANSLWQSTTDEIAQAGTELKTLYATRTGLANQLSGFQASLDKIERPTPQLASLQGKAATLQNAYRLADQRASEARIADAMDQQLRLNVAVASRPSFSNTATSPSPWLYGAAIALAVLFLAACLILFAGAASHQYAAQQQHDDDYEDEEDPAGHHQFQDYDAGPGDEQQQIPFPSRLRSSRSGAFLYAAPGGSVPQQPPAPEPTVVHIDPAFEPIRHSPSLSDILAQPTDPIEPTVFSNVEATPKKTEEHPGEDHAPEPGPYPSPTAEIFHPHQYTQAESREHDSSTDPSSVHPPFSRPSNGETHAAVPYFFAAPPSASLTTEPEEDHDLAHEEGPPYPFFHDRPAPDPSPDPVPHPVPDPAAPFPSASESVPATAPPAPAAEEPAPLFSAVPTPRSEPFVTTPDPTPPWSQPAPELTPAPVPPPSYWASVYESEPAAPHAAPQPVATAPEPIIPEPPAPSPTYTEPIYVVPQAPEPVAPLPAEPLYTIPVVTERPTPPEPVAAAPEPAAPTPRPIAPPVTPQALPQAFTSTVRPAPFLTTLTSTLSAPAFRFTPPPARPDGPKEPPPAPPVLKAALAPEPTPKPVLQPTPAPAASEPELVLSYASSEPIELTPDPILPPVKLPYKIQTPQSADPAPAPEPARVQPPEFSEFPLYRAPKPILAREPASEASAGSPRPQTYEEMVRALVYPEASAPYVPPARPTAPAPRRAEPVPEPLPPTPPAAAPADDDAPPFHYVRKSVPEPAPTQGPASMPTSQLEDYEALQNFIRRPSVPLQPTPARSYADDRDDRTTYRAAQPASHAPSSSPEPPRSSWIDIAPPPPPRAADLDPQKRAPDRISAIRDESVIRARNLVDESGHRLTPSERMKRGRPVPTVDKDGKVSYLDYLNDQDKPRY